MVDAGGTTDSDGGTPTQPVSPDPNASSTHKSQTALIVGLVSGFGGIAIIGGALAAIAWRRRHRHSAGSLADAGTTEEVERMFHRTGDGANSRESRSYSEESSASDRSIEMTSVPAPSPAALTVNAMNSTGSTSEGATAARRRSRGASAETDDKGVPVPSSTDTLAPV